MNRERTPHEHPTAKDFGWKVDPDLEHGLLRIIDGGMTYIWFLTASRVAILRNEDERKLSKEKLQAMKEQVYAILGPQIPSSE